MSISEQNFVSEKLKIQSGQLIKFVKMNKIASKVAQADLLALVGYKVGEHSTAKSVLGLDYIRKYLLCRLTRMCISFSMSINVDFFKFKAIM